MKFTASADVRESQCGMPHEPLSEVVIVSPYFPPSTLAGVHRARHLAKHLPSVGWWPIVVCVDEVYHEERLDPDLATLVPPTVEIVKVGAIAARMTHQLGFGDISLRGFLPLRRKLFRLLKARPIAAVLITGSPYYPMLLAPEIKRRFGVPVVLDFQDPWVSAWGAVLPRLSKNGLSHALASALEPRTLRAASFITSVSETQNAQMGTRYPWVDRQRMAAIPIGIDREDFDALRRIPPKGSSVNLDDSCINISHVGTIAPAGTQVVQVLMNALARLKSARPELTDGVRFNFIGTSNQPNGFREFRVMPLAQSAGVTELVKEVPQRVPYLEALGILTRSDGLLMVGSDEAHYTASRVYPNLMSGRPYLSIYHRASSGHAILSEAGGGVALAFSNSGELHALQDKICEGLEQLLTSPGSMGRADAAVYAAYEAKKIAQRFADVFDLVDKERRRTHTCA